MAKHFRFKLQPVLRYRERIEEEVRNRFSHIQAIRNEKQNELDRVRHESQMARDSMNDAKVGNIDIPKLRTLNRYITGLSVSERQREGELKVIDVEVEKRRVEYVAARQQTKVMEQVRDRRKAEHEYAEGQEETKLFDEIASQKVLARRREVARLAELARLADAAQPDGGSIVGQSQAS